MTDKLLNCPFCGGQAKWFNSECKVYCVNCACSTIEFIDKRDAIEAWNTRRPMDRVVEQLEEKKKNFSFPKHCKSIGVCPPDKTCSECIVEKFVEDIIAIVKGVQNE